MGSRLALFAAVLLLVACSPSTPPPKSQGQTSAASGGSSAGAAPAKASPGAARKAAAEARRKAKNRRIIGEVRAILKAKHSPLPELQRKNTDSREHPTAQVVNDTPYRLDVWFAGPCSEKLNVPAKGSAEVQFCPGAYHIAAKVDTPDFLPLVRENQDFELGIHYVLRIIIRAQPKTIIKRSKR